MEEKQADIDTALDRTIFLSDGVFAIAITLLVLEIAVPTGITASRQAQDLPGRILGLLPAIGSYALSFVIVGTYWMAHQRVFHFIRRANNGLLWLNVLFLLTVAFLPVPTHVLGLYGDVLAAPIFYAVSLAVSGLVLLALWEYAASGHRLVKPSLDAAVIRHQRGRLLVTPIIAVLSIGVAFVSPYLAETSWLLVGLVIYLYERRFNRARAAHHREATVPVGSHEAKGHEAIIRQMSGEG